LGLVIGTNVLAPNGSAASLTNLPAGGASAAEATNIMLNAFRISVNGGLSVQNMVDGVVDEFEDETGIDTSTSTNEVYNTDDFYENQSIADFTSGGTCAGSSFGSNAGSHANLVDDSSSTWYDAVNNTQQWWTIQTTTSKIATSWTAEIGNNGSADLNSSISFVLQGSATGSWGGEEVTLDTIVTNPAINNHKHGPSSFSNSTSYEYYRVLFNHTSGWLVWEEIEIFGVVGLNNMTLVSNATTALAAPDDANIVIWQEDVDSITLNTDLKAYASRNGGTTYTQITLAEVASLTNGRILTGTVDISGQSSATAMKYKIETLNTKSQRIHAVALQWS
jgi:hypothetical protein